jgi:hypothetical protein
VVPSATKEFAAMRSCVFDVRVSHDDSGEWLVWLDALVVGRFGSALDALPFASLLECSPRARDEAKSGGGRFPDAPPIA